jgi:hypothetical protein
MSTATTQFNLSELYQNAFEQFESALKAGVKIQEESMKLMNPWSNGMPLVQAQKAQSALLQSMSSLPNQFQDAMEMMNEQAQNAMGMLHQAFEVGRSTNPAEAQEKTHQLWEMSLGVVRTNIHSMLKAHAAMMEKWEEVAGAVNPAAHNGNGHKGAAPT